MRVAWHHSRWSDWCVSEDEKKETKTFFEKGPQNLTLIWAQVYE